MKLARVAALEFSQKGKSESYSKALSHCSKSDGVGSDFISATRVDVGRDYPEIKPTRLQQNFNERCTSTVVCAHKAFRVRVWLLSDT